MNLITHGMLSQKIYKRFKDKYFEKYGVMLTDEENTRMALDLVNLMRVLLKPDTK